MPTNKGESVTPGSAKQNRRATLTGYALTNIPNERVCADTNDRARSFCVTMNERVNALPMPERTGAKWANEYDNSKQSQQRAIVCACKCYRCTTDSERERIIYTWANERAKVHENTFGYQQPKFRVPF